MSVVAGMPVRSSVASPAAFPRRRRGRRAAGAAGQVLGEDMFRRLLARERKRADRFGQQVVLVLIELTRRPDAGVAGAWRAIVQALVSAGRQSDVLGWYVRDQVLGLMLPDVDVHHACVVAGITARIEEMLSLQLPPATFDAVAVRVYGYCAAAPGSPAVSPDDPVGAQPPPAGFWPATRPARKRMLDIAGSIGLILLAAPLLALIALAVKATSKGPVLFRQTRIGRMGRPFTMLKFRTMRVDADPALHRDYVKQFIAARAAAAAGATEAPYKIANDPRVTPIGHFLRKTSLDEVPQFWNVLRGDMSLVGPRPPLPYEVEDYKPWHYRRVLEATPGITGLWQVTGRSRTTFDDMVRLDLRYARASSVRTDVRILLATPRAVLTGRGAR